MTELELFYRHVPDIAEMIQFAVRLVGCTHDLASAVPDRNTLNAVRLCYQIACVTVNQVSPAVKDNLRL